MKRAGLFAGALVLLWLAFQLLPSSPSEGDPLYTDTGTIASKPQTSAAPRHSPSLVKPGYVLAIALLAGGGAFAIYLRRRNGGVGPRSTPIKTLGVTQLAPGQQLRLVSCGGEVLLLGVTSSQINLLKSFPADAFERGPGESGDNEVLDGQPTSTAEHIGNSFAALLQQFGTAPTAQAATEEYKWPA